MERIEHSSAGVVTGGARYQIRVAERLSSTALAAFPELRLADDPTGSVLYGRVRDRSELLSILGRFDLLGMTIIEFHRLPD
jgi:ABC-type ATPase involved in cell division